MVTIGEYTYGEITRRGTGNTLTIGKFCSIAEGVLFDGGFNHSTKSISTYPFHRLLESVPSNIVIRGDINIGNDVWLGEGSTIMSGVTIGDGAIVGMNCIVSKDVRPYDIVVGAPQKVLRRRFDDDRVEELLKIKWWDWPIEKILANALYLQSNNIEQFINLYKIN
jgi:acetyltransferase-like isoleucine patch superfamily enzyme